MHHGEGRRKTGAGGGRKNQLITVPPQGKMSLELKKVLPTGKFRGLATLPIFSFFLPFFQATRQLSCLLGTSCVYVLLISHMAAGWDAVPAFSQSLFGAPTVSSFWHRGLNFSRLLFASSYPACCKFQSFDILWEVALVLQQNCYIPLRHDTASLMI